MTAAWLQQGHDRYLRAPTSLPIQAPTSLAPAGLARNLGTMIISACREEGVERVHVTRFASVETWFTEGEGGSGLILHVAPGHLAFPQDFQRNKAAVRAAVLSEVAARLGVPEQDVLSQSFRRLKQIADPALPEHYRYARRSKNRAYPLR